MTTNTMRVLSAVLLLGYAAKAQEESIAFKLDVKKDDVRWFTLATKSNFNIDTSSGVLEFSFDLKSDLSFTMMKKADDGSHEFEVKVLNVRGTAVDPTTSGSEITIDSTKPIDKDDFVAAGAAKRFLRVVNKRFKLILGANGRLEKFESIERLPPAGMPSLGVDPLDLYMRTLKDSFEMVPAEAVKNGETKDIAEPISLMAFKSTAKGQKKVEKVGPEDVTISMTAKLEGTPSGNEDTKDSEKDVMKEMMSKMTFEDSTVSRSIVIGRKDGVLSSSSMNLKAVVSMPNQLGGDGDMSITVDVTNSLKRSEAPKTTPESQPAEKK